MGGGGVPVRDGGVGGGEGGEVGSIENGMGSLKGASRP